MAIRRAFHASGTVLLLAAGWTMAAGAQGPPASVAPAAQAAMKKLDFFLGKWAGEGWIQMGPGPRAPFTQSELVESRLEGALIVVEGVGHDRSEPPRKVHHAFGIFSFDPASSSYRFKAYRAENAAWIDVEASLEARPDANVVVWGFEPPGGGRVRYTITVAGNTWSEVGDYARDGASWSRFFEMKLTRQP